MKKVKLEVLDLAVESFETGAEEAEERGTVFGNVKKTDIRYCGSGFNCYTDNERECATAWYGCNTQQCSQYQCDTIEGSDCV
ncbi:MAG TPA: hypothetical protein VFS20_05205 [Longimicrobium sp.]|nr:hypothetical protein [Longimicrobium sp.]